MSAISYDPQTGVRVYCGRCRRNGVTEDSISTVRGILIRRAFCEECGARGYGKVPAAWQGIIEEGRALIYHRWPVS